MRSFILSATVFLFLGLLISACNPEDSTMTTETQTTQQEFAIALHGGAGAIPRDTDPEIRDAYLAVLTEALEIGTRILDEGGDALDAVELVIRYLEDEPLFNAGRGAVMTNSRTFELDASIMDGRDLNAGAVAGVRTVKNPISLARIVMEDSPHVMFAGPGAESFAEQSGVELVEQDWFFTERRQQQLERALELDEVMLDNSQLEQKEDFDERKMGTVGVAALDRNGNLAAGTSTGGMTNKRYGRVGDAPIIGAGTYADNNSCAVSATGHGEKFIRNSVAYQICAIMEYKGSTLNEAANIVIHEKLQPGDGGIIAVSKTGEIAMVFNSPGMFRAAANSDGHRQVAIWE